MARRVGQRFFHCAGRSWAKAVRRGTTGVAAQIFAQPGLTVVPVRDTGPGVELGLVWRADSGPSALTQELTCRLAELIDKEPMHV
ncbi:MULTISPECIES: hypothetical protein [unclassified Streptomyces]|uniref:hypothetical protein n=1 Tax=unclassified Streptomyces TaxID=2593676 RepID=UPI0034020399